MNQLNESRAPQASQPQALRPSVSALVPAWQAGEFIQETLDSLSAQTHPNFRVIVSVDLCDDDTFAICAAHAARDARVSVYRQSRRLSYVGNCNFLLQQADTDYAVFAFHDDLLAPDYLDKVCAVLDERPEVVMAYSDVLLTGLDGETEHWKYRDLDGIGDPVARGNKMLWREGLWWVPNRGVFRLHRARRIGGLKTHAAGEFSADNPWLLHMALLGEFQRVPETLCFKYYKMGSISRGWAFTRAQWYAVTLACFREVWGSELTVGEKLRLSTTVASRLPRHLAKAIKTALPTGSRDTTRTS